MADTPLAAGSSDPLRRRQSFTSQALFEMETQQWGPVIHAVMELEGPVDTAEVKKILSSELLQYPRFRSVVEPEYTWVETDVDVDEHVLDVDLPGQAPQAEMEAFVGEHMLRAFPPNRPMWQVFVLRYGNGVPHVDLVWRISHSIGDGITLASILVHMTQPVGEVREQSFRPRVRRANWVWLVHVLVLAAALAMYLAVFKDEDWRVWTLVGPLALLVLGDRKLRVPLESLGKVLWLPYTLKDRQTLIKAGMNHPALRADNKFFSRGREWPVADLKRCAAAHEFKGEERCTVNDICMSLVAGGIRRYLESHNDPNLKSRQSVRALSIVNIRAAKGLAAQREMLERLKDPAWSANSFSYYIIPMDIGQRSAPDRLLRTHKAMSWLKRSPEGWLVDRFYRALWPLTGIKALVALSRFNLGKMHLFVSNLPGPQHAVSFAGRRVRNLFNCTGPLEFGVSVSLLSYDGTVTPALSGDKAFCEDPHHLLECMWEEFAELMPEDTSV